MRMLRIKNRSLYLRISDIDLYKTEELEELLCEIKSNLSYLDLTLILNESNFISHDYSSADNSISIMEIMDTEDRADLLARFIGYILKDAKS